MATGVPYIWLGSSPLARGAPRQPPGCTSRQRIIPARAGSTNPGFGSLINFSDHPRSRGEHVGFLVLGLGLLGSSPLARGALHTILVAAPRTRIIPARAGSTPGAVCDLVQGWDHPRSRGEHLAGRLGMRRLEGSSPLARGAQRSEPLTSRPARIIPARAGSTKFPPTQSLPCRDHPRSRGEHLDVFESFQNIRGSSPLARGARHAEPQDLPPTPDHPRSRGEHRPMRSPQLKYRGSSPLARGAQAGLTQNEHRWRIIPARAGSTSLMAASAQRTSDHPRSRGEHLGEPTSRATQSGSSPLARGAHALGLVPHRLREDHPRSRGEHWDLD